MAKVESQPDLQRRADEVEHAEDGIPEETVAFAVDRIVDQLSLIETALERGCWITGDTFSLADMAVLPFVQRFQANGFDEPTDAAVRPRLAEWIERIMARPAVQQAYAFTDPATG